MGPVPAACAETCREPYLLQRITPASPSQPGICGNRVGMKNRDGLGMNQFALTTDLPAYLEAAAFRR